MKPFKVVCVSDTLNRCSRNIPTLFDQICKREIYTVIDVVESNYTGTKKQYYILSERRADAGYSSSMFRPVTDCGDAICEYIEDVHFKDFEYQEIFKQLCQ